MFGDVFAMTQRIQRFLLPGFLFILDTLILIFSAWFAMIIRFPDHGVQFAFYTPEFTLSLPVMLLCYLFFYIICKLHRRIWQYAGPKEMMHIILANLGGFFLFMFYAWAINLSLPRSIYPLTMFMATLLVAISRLSLRYIYYTINKQEKEGQPVSVLIVGAGEAGSLLLQDIQNHYNYKVVGFIDDDKAKQGRLLRGIPVLGNRDKIAELVAKYDVKDIIVAMPSLSGLELKKIVELCESTQCRVKILPGFFSNLDTSAIKLQDLRPIAVEDLLKRDPVKLDLAKIGEFIKDKVILVTGAGGSIGSEICRQIMYLHPRRIILLGRGENSIYEVHQELTHNYPQADFVPVIMNITNKILVEQLFQQYHPQVVFHAAAHKHVPLMERQPEEAIYNNVVGSWNVADLAGKYGVERFVLISTDKAVNPTSVMGATKRVTEMIMQALNKKYAGTKFMAVRFGNVLGSRGSVVPLFKKQIAAGGPVTITNPEMKRYFMTIPEASQLVLEAGALGQGGEVFVLDMGEPVKIVDLAKDMISLSGLEPDKDIKLEYTGLRPGEKLFEELLTAEEGTVATKNSKIFQAILKDQDPAILRPQLEKLIACKDNNLCITMLQELIPTYHPNHF